MNIKTLYFLSFHYHLGLLFGPGIGCITKTESRRTDRENIRMALCLTLNSSSFKFDSVQFELETSKIIKIKTDEFKEIVVLKDSMFNKFLKNLLTDENIFDGKTENIHIYIIK